MNKLLPLITVFAFFVASCGANQKPPEFSDPEQTIEVSAGSEFIIDLAANPTTGYHWEFVNEPDSSIVKFVSRDYKGDEPAAVGSGGTEKWTFQAVAAGTVQITLGYYPPSNDPVEPQQSTTFTVIVK